MEHKSIKISARTKIINTTIKMMEKQGYNNITTNYIADRADISIGTLYYHFGNGKRDILKAIFQQNYEKLLAFTPSFEIDIKKLSPKDFINTLGPFLLNNIKLHRKLYPYLAALEMEFLANKELYSELKDFYVQESNKLIDLIKQFVSKNLDTFEALEGKLQNIVNVVDCIIHRHIFYEGSFDSDEEIVEILIEIIITLIKHYN